MLASITPLGERGRGSIWAVTVTAFALGATLGGTGIGLAAGALGWLLVPAGLDHHLRLGLLAVALALATALDAGLGPVPGPRRQVNERWLDEFRGWVYGLGFGAQLGAGITTVVTSAGTYVALVAALLLARPGSGALIGALFGAVRGLTPLLGLRARSPSELIALHCAMTRLRRPSRWATVAGLGALTLVALAGALA